MSTCPHKTHFNTLRALLAHPNYCRNKDLNRSIKCKINTLACNIVVANAAKVYWVQIFFKHLFIFSCSQNRFNFSSSYLQVYLWGGLLLFCGFIVWDTQMIIEKRKRGDRDFIKHSLDLFIDFMQVFRRVVVLLMQKVINTFTSQSCF